VNAAKTYQTSRADVPFMVAYRDPLQRLNGRAKRVVKWFTSREAADAYALKINETILTDGTAGLRFDAALRADAIAARQALDIAGLDVSLVELARAAAARNFANPTKRTPILAALDNFLEAKRSAENARERTVTNLETRLRRWFDAEHFTAVEEINRQTVESLRVRPGVGARSRINDMAAVSAFCTWAVDRAILPVHPLIGLKRPTPTRQAKPIFMIEEMLAVLTAARAKGNEALATATALLFIGCRPSELAETRLFYGRSPVARIEGGKLRGRANRTVPLSAAAVAWFKSAGAPVSLRDFTRREREDIAEAASVTWKPDICRHTFISHRLQIVKDDAAVAREAGTSEAIIYRHYHQLVMPKQAKAWAGLRPDKKTIKIPA
jgi:integrase